MIEFDKLIEICKKHGAEFLEDAPLAPLTTFKIGGPCDLLIRANNRDLLREIVIHCKKNDTVFRVIGKGSNILVRDEGFKGVIIVLDGEFMQLNADGNDGVVTCGAGVSLTMLCTAAREYSLTGIEFAYGIPGSVGGAVYMNAGAYGGEIGHVLHMCKYLDDDGEIKTADLTYTDFSYRKSPFTGTKKIILDALFVLEKGDKAQISAKMNEIMQKRRDKQPLEFPSAGSTFKRPEGDYASRLIDVCGLKGLYAGGAQVSEKHAGFIINKGGATCKNVLELIEKVQEKVLKETGVRLEREVEII